MATAADPTGNVIVVMNIPGTSQSSVGLRATRYDAATGTWSAPVDLVTTGTGEFAVAVQAVMDRAIRRLVVRHERRHRPGDGPARRRRRQRRRAGELHQAGRRGRHRRVCQALHGRVRDGGRRRARGSVDDRIHVLGQRPGPWPSTRRATRCSCGRGGPRRSRPSALTRARPRGVPSNGSSRPTRIPTGRPVHRMQMGHRDASWSCGTATAGMLCSRRGCTDGSMPRKPGARLCECPTAARHPASCSPTRVMPRPSGRQASRRGWPDSMARPAAGPARSRLSRRRSMAIVRWKTLTEPSGSCGGAHPTAGAASDRPHNGPRARCRPSGRRTRR